MQAEAELVLMAELEPIDKGARRVLPADGQALGCDQLIVAGRLGILC